MRPNEVRYIMGPALENACARHDVQAVACGML